MPSAPRNPRTLTAADVFYPSYVTTVSKALSLAAAQTHTAVTEQARTAAVGGRSGSRTFEEQVATPVLASHTEQISAALRDAALCVTGPAQSCWTVVGGRFTAPGADGAGAATDRAAWDVELQLDLHSPARVAAQLAIPVNVKFAGSATRHDNLCGARAFATMMLGMGAGVRRVEDLLAAVGSDEQLGSDKLTDYFLLAFEKTGEPLRPVGEVWVSSVLSADPHSQARIFNFNPAQTFPHLQMAYGQAAAALAAGGEECLPEGIVAARIRLRDWVLGHTLAYHQRFVSALTSG